jgi:serine/threonine protein phosphatase PrpC
MNDPSNADTAEFSAPNTIRLVAPPRPFSSRIQVDLAATSDRGRVRPANEDHYLVVRFGRELETLLTNLPDGDVPARSEETGYGMVIADGIGGSAAGEVASRLAIQSLVNLVLGTPDWIMRPKDGSSKEVMRRAVERYGKVHHALAEQATEDYRLEGMGTTMTLACSVGADLFITHVGDSRCYLFRQRILCQLTRDHTMAQALADHGYISQESVPAHKLRHVLTQALGAGKGEVKPDVDHARLEDGDCLLLCSDGLTEMVDDSIIASVLERGDASEPTCRRLIELALEAGGADNVTVIVARYHFPPTP